MNIKITLVLVFFYSNLIAQNQNSIWCFGDSAGIDFSNVNNPIPINTSMDGRGSCVSIADTNGDLLFYSNTRSGLSGNTTLVWSKNHQIMQNGDSIVGEGWYNELLIIPFPNNTDKYYLFSIGVTGSSQSGLFYSVIDISLNNGFGAVIQKNIQLLNVKIADGINAIKHGNGKDWWLIAKLYNSPTSYNRFFVFKISSNGISTPLIYDFNNASDGGFQKIVFNKSGNKIMQLITSGFMCEFDFDRCNGTVTNPNLIFNQQTGNYSRIFWEGTYSPNDSLFYVSTTWINAASDTSRFLQFNLFSSNIPLSCDTLFFSKNPILHGAPRLAPDNKIYYASTYNFGGFAYPYPDSVYNQYNMNLSVVNNPNGISSTCNFQPFSFNLGGKRTYVGLPNNPNYSLGPLIGSVCDTLHLDLQPNKFQNLNEEVRVYFDKNWQIAFINASGLKGEKFILQIFDLFGHTILENNGIVRNGYATFDANCANLAIGVYIARITTEKENLSCKFVKD